jgi:hypothetical protein
MAPAVVREKEGSQEEMTISRKEQIDCLRQLEREERAEGRPRAAIIRSARLALRALAAFERGCSKQQERELLRIADKESREYFRH